MHTIKIGEFVKLTGTTLKTVNYYHKIGLLPAPERSGGGYRLYGPAQLNRMRLIKRLKSLGLDLKQIKGMLGNVQEPSSAQAVLTALRGELLDDIKDLQERVAKIDALLGADASLLDADSFDSPSLQMTAEILGPAQIEKYAQDYPEMYDQHRRLYGILDDFQWGEDFKETFSSLAQFFKEHPQEFNVSLDYAQRLGRISDLQEDDPEIDALARESASLIKAMPMLREILFKQQPIKEPLESVYDELVAGVLSPARIKYNKLLQKYLGFEGSMGD